MIKVQNNTATREPIPVFLQGLAPESLADLSWTDPSLGVADAAWLPEVDQSPTLGKHERYGEETLTVNGGVVIVTRAVVPWTQEEIASETVSQAAQIRSERNRKLFETDWTQLVDSTVEKDIWAVYRQSLRDVTAQAGFPWDIVWPNKP